jgi:hypothetical protein
MLQSLLSAIVEIVLEAMCQSVIKFFGLENAVTLARSLVGLTFIAIGFAIWWFGH